MTELAVCFRGNANTWECDEMGHMNVRFYVSKAKEGLDVFGGLVGLKPTWLAGNGAELVFKDQHIRFVKEFHGGHDLFITAGILEASEIGFRLYQEVRHSDGTIGASVISWVELRDIETQERLRLSDSLQNRLGHHAAIVAEGAGPRSIPLEGHIPGGNKDKAEEIGMVQVSLGSVVNNMVDVHGRLNAEGCIGRVSDGIGHFMRGLRTPGPRAPDTQAVRNIGGAAVEYRLRYHNRPKVGDTVAVYAGLYNLGRSVFDVSHWTVNMATGEPVCSSRAIALSLDLEARKAISIPEETRVNLEAYRIAALDVECVDAA